MNKNKVVIIGAGPAGIACAVQLKRFGFEPLLFEKNQVGGLLRNAGLVENYLGFDYGISGLELVKKFKKNLDILYIKPVFSNVKKVSYLDGNFYTETDDTVFTSEFLVVASGTKPKKLCLPCPLEQSTGESAPLQDTDTVSKSGDFLSPNGNIKHVHEIADLEKISYRGKKFLIVGAGDAAFDYAINLVRNYGVSEVNILNRSNQAKCLPLLEQRAVDTKKIIHNKNVRITSVKEKDNKIIFKCFTDEKIFLSADYVISAVGREACSDFLSDEIINNSENLNQKGLLHFIGDVKNGHYRQTSIASGDGIKAAMKIYNCINENL